MKTAAANTTPGVLETYFTEMAEVPVMSSDQEASSMRRIEEMEGGLLLSLLLRKAFAKGHFQKLLDAMEAEQLPTDEVRAALRSKAPRELIRAVKFTEPGRAWLEPFYGRLTKTPADSTPEHREWLSATRAKMAEVGAAKNQFVSANLRLVILIAKKYRKPSSSITLADLIQEGNIGLMKAVDRFDVERGFKFSTYGLWWIRHHIKRAIDDRDSLVRLPVHLMDNARRISRAAAVHRAVTGESMGEDELAAATGLTPSKVKAVISHRINGVVSIHAPVIPDGEVSVEDLIEGNGPKPDDELIRTRLKGEIQKVLTALTPMESRIVRWRLGLDGCEELTLQEIANKYGLSRERIRQIEAKAYEKMKHRSDLKEYR